MNPNFDKLSSQINDLLPKDFSLLKDDVKGQVRALIQDGLKKMDLVTREEFDIQSRVLARTREKLEALEHLVAKIEQDCNSNNN